MCNLAKMNFEKSEFSYKKFFDQFLKKNYFGQKMRIWNSVLNALRVFMGQQKSKNNFYVEVLTSEAQEISFRFLK